MPGCARASSASCPTTGRAATFTPSRASATAKRAADALLAPVIQPCATVRPWARDLLEPCMGCSRRAMRPRKRRRFLAGHQADALGPGSAMGVCRRSRRGRRHRRAVGARGVMEGPRRTSRELGRHGRARVRRARAAIFSRRARLCRERAVCEQSRPPGLEDPRPIDPFQSPDVSTTSTLMDVRRAGSLACASVRDPCACESCRRVAGPPSARAPRPHPASGRAVTTGRRHSMGRAQQPEDSPRRMRKPAERTGVKCVRGVLRQLSAWRGFTDCRSRQRRARPAEDRARRVVPEHGHAGAELTLVLRGPSMTPRALPPRRCRRPRRDRRAHAHSRSRPEMHLPGGQRETGPLRGLIARLLRPCTGSNRSRAHGRTVGTAWDHGSQQRHRPRAGRSLARDGVKVAASARSSDKLAELARAHPGIAPPLPSTSRPRSMAQAVRSIAGTLGPIDLAVLNAGIWRRWPPGISPPPSRALHGGELQASSNGIEAVLPAMLERGQGHIAMVASVPAIAARDRRRPTADQAAVINLANAAHDLAVAGITVSVSTRLRRHAVPASTSSPMPIWSRPRTPRAASSVGWKKASSRIAFPWQLVGAHEARPLMPHRAFFWYARTILHRRARNRESPGLNAQGVQTSRLGRCGQDHAPIASLRLGQITKGGSCSCEYGVLGSVIVGNAGGGRHQARACGHARHARIPRARTSKRGSATRRTPRPAHSRRSPSSARW